MAMADYIVLQQHYDTVEEKADCMMYTWHDAACTDTNKRIWLCVCLMGIKDLSANVGCLKRQELGVHHYSD